MTKTRKVDEFGNVRYDVTVGGKLIGQIHKTCSAWQVEPAPFTSYAPIASVTKGMEWLALYARVMAKSAAHFDGREDDMTTTGTTLTATAARMAKAATLIASGLLNATNVEGVYRATGSTGTVYLTSANWCHCEAGQRGNACYHSEAARIRLVADLRARLEAAGTFAVRDGRALPEPVGADVEPGELYG
jgi:uncharacterized protein (DUF697 family)